MSLVHDLVATAWRAPEGDVPPVVLPEAIPDQRPPVESADVPLDVYAELQHISECYLACRARAEVLRGRLPSGDAGDRTARDNLVRALERLSELRERRAALLDAYDLPSTAGLAAPGRRRDDVSSEPAS